MATGSLPRGLAILQCLVGVSEGVPLSRIAELVDLPKSATHRILTTLIEGILSLAKNSQEPEALRAGARNIRTVLATLRAP